MSNYIDYVYCQGVPDYQTRHLFQTKAWSGIEAGNIVFAAGYGVAAFTVIAVSTVEGDGEVRRLTGKMITFEED